MKARLCQPAVASRLQLNPMLVDLDQLRREKAAETALNGGPMCREARHARPSGTPRGSRSSVQIRWFALALIAACGVACNESPSAPVPLPIVDASADPSVSVDAAAPDASPTPEPDAPTTPEPDAPTTPEPDGGGNARDCGGARADGASSSGDGGTSSADARAPFDATLTGDVGQFCRALGRVNAETTAACNGGTVDDWLEVENFGCTCDKLEELARAGYVRLDLTEANRCLSAMQTAACDERSMLLAGEHPDSCWNAVVGQKPIGSACMSHLYNECTPDAYCRSATGTDGTCVARTLRGESCEELGVRCSPGLVCDCPTPVLVSTQGCGTAGHRICIEPHPAKQLGETCGGEFHRYKCAPNLACKQDSSWFSICRTTVPGHSCSGKLDCRVDERCECSTCIPNTDGPCTSPGEVCAEGYACFNRKCEPKRQAGDPCEQARDQCVKGTGCDLDNTCRQEPKVGEPCTRAGSPDCVRSFCKTVDTSTRAGVCTPFLAEGEPCGYPGTPGNECGHGDCDFMTKTCKKTCY